MKIPTDAEVLAYFEAKQAEAIEIFGDKYAAVSISKFGSLTNVRIDDGHKSFCDDTMAGAMQKLRNSPATTAADLRSQAAEIIARADKIDPPRRRQPLDARACKDG